VLQARGNDGEDRIWKIVKKGIANDYPVSFKELTWIGDILKESTIPTFGDAEYDILQAIQVEFIKKKKLTKRSQQFLKTRYGNLSLPEAMENAKTELTEIKNQGYEIVDEEKGDKAKQKKTIVNVTSKGEFIRNFVPS